MSILSKYLFGAMVLLLYTITDGQDFKEFKDIHWDKDGNAFCNGFPYTGQVGDMDSQGNHIFEGSYKNSRPTGAIKQWYNRGNMVGNQKFIYNYNENGQLDGTQMEWYEDGQVKKEATYVEGIEEGAEKQYYSNGKKKYVALYIHGHVDGNVTYFDTEGNKIKEEYYRNGGNDGIWVTYINGSKRNVVIYNNGILDHNEVYSSDGKPDSVWNYYFTNGHISKTETYANGKPNSKWNEYYQSGHISKSETYINGIPEGEADYFDENGNITTKTYFHNGIEDVWHTYVVSNIPSNVDYNLFSIPFAWLNQAVTAMITIDTRNGSVVNFNGGNSNGYINAMAYTIQNAIPRIRGIYRLQPSDYVNHSSDTVRYKIAISNIQITVITDYDLSKRFNGYYSFIEFDIDNELYYINPNVVAINQSAKDKQHIKIKAPRLIAAFVYPTQDQAINQTLKSSAISESVSNFIFHNFPIFSNIKQITESKSGGSAGELELDEGAAVGLENNWIVNVYEYGNPSVIGTLKIKQINQSSSICKVKDGGDVITKKLQAGSRLYIKTQ